ncbi:THAP domain-containing protein 6 isoform X6 [Entelurus aequoreus]|uniref:THAP domain-containing protein 6 isoform X6 n=1 Tax=Entelurus aequoreus TaxID=161455 RepID=UPI002B1D766C|nr:THAP domain-containing protein 6 isoform X6 [Entelurus aequoreus]
MPQYCAALGCVNKRTADTKTKRITFHKFPKEKELRKQWEVAARKKGFSATKSTVLCSEHFKPHDIDATGQTVRIREGARPSVFNFQYPLQKHVFTRTTKTSKKAQERLKAESECSGNLQQAKPPSLHLPSVDHCYALPASPADVKARLTEALARVESLEHELRIVKDRERRSKNTVFCLLEDMRGKNLINEDLKEKLHSYSELSVCFHEICDGRRSARFLFSCYYTLFSPWQPAMKGWTSLTLQDKVMFLSQGPSPTQ